MRPKRLGRMASVAVLLGTGLLRMAVAQTDPGGHLGITQDRLRQRLGRRGRLPRLPEPDRRRPPFRRAPGAAG